MIKKDASTMAMPLSMQRTEPAPIDAYSIWYSLADAQEYAAGTGTNKAAYVGQIITVVDEANQKATAYVIVDTAGTLQEVGSGTAQPIIFVDNESQMLALTEIEAGQQVYRADTKTVWIFKGGDASSLSNWVESAAQNDTVWSGTEDKVIFYALTMEQYKALDTKDANTLYFVTDTQRLFVGETEYTRPVQHGKSLPTEFVPPNSFFFHETEKALYYSEGGTKWVKCSDLTTIPNITVENTATQVKDIAFGEQITVITNLAVDAKDKHKLVTQTGEYTLPKMSVTTHPSTGNVVTGITISNDGKTLGVTKDKTFVEANALITGGTHTKITYDANGLVTSGTGLAATDIPALDAAKITSGTFDVARIPNLTLSKITDAGTAAGKDFTNAINSTDATEKVKLPTAEAVQNAINSAVGDITSFDVQIVATFDKLPTTGKKGVIYLVPHTHGTSDSYDEYMWVPGSGSTGKYEKIGNTDITLTQYTASKGIKITGEGTTKNIEHTNSVTAVAANSALKIAYDAQGHITGSAALTKADIDLGNVDNTADAEKSVKSAGTLTTARTIGISGAVTGTATEFDGSQNITINTTSVDGSKIDANSEIRVRDVTVSDAVATDNITTYTSAFGTLNIQAGTVALAGANGDAVAINNVATPTADKDAANKKYVDDHQLKWGTF